VFQEQRAVCHDNPGTRAPARASLRVMSANSVAQHPAFNICTNYVNEVEQTDIDLPVVALREAG